jgi:hypothetical protein
MAILNLDFSNVKELTNLSIGKHVLKVTKVEQQQASTGNAMLTVTFVNGAGEVGIDYFVLTESAMWKLQGLLQALFKTPFKGLVNLNTDTMIGRTCEATAREEEYMKQDGTAAIRTVIDNYRPVSEAGPMGIAPQDPTAPVIPAAPVAPTPVQPTVQPQFTQTPVQPTYTAPAAPVAPTPVQPTVATPVTPTAPTGAPKRPWEM